jgi:DNA-binding transcriptional LysR family regulator
MAAFMVLVGGRFFSVSRASIRLLQAAIAVAEELHFSRAADRLNMSQSTLSKQILKLENELGFRLFEHNHQAAELTDAGRVFIAEAREVVAHAERAVLSARAIADGPVEILNIGKSSYTDPLFVSTLLSIHLPLFPDMKIKLWSNYSNESAQRVIAGALDLALITGVPHKPKLSTMIFVRIGPTAFELFTANKQDTSSCRKRSASSLPHLPLCCFNLSCMAMPTERKWKTP